MLEVEAVGPGIERAGRIGDHLIVVGDGLQAVADLHEGFQNGLLIVGHGGAGGVLGHPLLRLQLALVEDRDGHAGAKEEAGRAIAEQVLGMQGALGDRTGQGQLRIEVGLGHADLGGGRVQAGLGGADVRPVADEVGRQLHRQACRRGEAVEGEVRRGPLRRRLADQQGQGVAGDRQLLAQRRHLPPVAGQFGLHRGHVEARAAAQLVGLGHQVEVLLIALYDLLAGGDLRVEGGDVDGLAHHLGGQGEIGGVSLEALGLGLGPQRLGLAPPAAEQVEVVAAGQAELVNLEGRVGEGDRPVRPRQLREAEGGQVHPVFGDRGVGVELQARLLRQHGVARLGEVGAGGLQRAVAVYGLAHRLVELGGAEQSPPVGGQPVADRRLGRGRVAGHGVARRRRRRGRLEVGPDGGAAGEYGAEGGEADEGAKRHGATP